MSRCPFCGRERVDPAGAPEGLPCERCAAAVDVSHALGTLEAPGFELSGWASRAGRFPAVSPPPASALADRLFRAVRRHPQAIMVLAGAVILAIGIALGLLLSRRFF